MSEVNSKKEIRKEDELEDEVKEPEFISLKTKTIPCIITLAGGLVAAVSTYVQHYPLRTALLAIFLTMLVFMILGDVMKMLLDRIKIEIPVEEIPEEEEAVEEEETEQQEE